MPAIESASTDSGSELVKLNIVTNTFEDERGVRKNEVAKEAPVVGFMYLGVVSLICFNFLILVLAYLNSRIHPNFGKAAMVIYGFSNNAAQFLCIFLNSRVSFYKRLVIPSIGFALAMIGYPVLAYLDIQITYHFAILLTMCLGVCTAVSLSAGFGLACIDSERAINYYCFGQALAGVLGWPLITCLGFLYRAVGFSTLPDPKYNGATAVDSLTTLSTLLIGAATCLGTIPYLKFKMARTYGHILYSSRQSEPVTRKTFRSLFPYAAASWCIMFITFLVFPSTVEKWKPSFGGYPLGSYFFFSFSVYIFQVFDVVGRYIAIAGITVSEITILISAPSRLILAIPFWLAIASWTVFRFDLVRFCMLALLGVTNGFLMSNTMTRGAEAVQVEQRSAAGYILSFALSNGIFIGSVVAMFLDKFLVNKLLGDRHVVIPNSEVETMIKRVAAGFPGS